METRNLEVRHVLRVVVERHTAGLKVMMHVPTELVGPAAEMIDAICQQLGPAGSLEGFAEAAGALAGLVDGARVTSAFLVEERSAA